ncbi:lysine--tRNA ligase [Candidatus Microgenomates bacterium]|nr:lysine--tRNA ligase [Candidatus Microgenomates bacterium]
MEQDFKKIRLEKLENLKKMGVNSYPAKFDRTHTSAEALKLKMGAKKVRVAGRLMLIRDLGRICFAHIQDGAGRIQIAFNEKEIGKEQYKFFIKNFDLGDFIGVEGETFKTKAGEKTILVKKFEILTKSLLPLPDKWHGITDTEERYRRRHLDLIFNKEAKEKFITRNKIIKSLTGFLEDKGFLEVDTPIIQPMAGGAIAEPFKTRYNAYDADVYLRIAPELYLKRLIIGGFEKVYEIGKAFRNEGVDANHNPEFTILEFYWAYADYENLMKLTEEMLIRLAKDVFGKNYITAGGKKIIFKKPFARKTFAQVTGGKKSDEAFKNGIKKLIQPTFVIDHPTELLPLAKKNKDGKTVQSFQLIVAGQELVKAYSELNDPADQLARFEEQDKNRKKGDKEAHQVDNNYIEALEYGMPPTAGWGMGVDRLVKLLTDSETLREIMFFPYMREKDKKIKN